MMGGLRRPLNGMVTVNVTRWPAADSARHDVHSQGERNSYGIRHIINLIVYVRHHTETIQGLEEFNYQQRETSGQRLPESRWQRQKRDHVIDCERGGDVATVAVDGLLVWSRVVSLEHQPGYAEQVKQDAASSVAHPYWLAGTHLKSTVPEEKVRVSTGLRLTRF